MKSFNVITYVVVGVGRISLQAAVEEGAPRQHQQQQWASH